MVVTQRMALQHTQRDRLHPPGICARQTAALGMCRICKMTTQRSGTGRDSPGDVQAVCNL